MRQVSTGLKGLHRTLDQIEHRLLQTWAKNTILGPPDHMQRLIRKGCAAAGESTTSREGRQGIRPTRDLQMQRGDLLLRSADRGSWISKGLRTKTSAHSRPGKKPDSKPVEHGRQRHGPAAEAGGSQQQQLTDPLGVASGQLDRNSPTHRCSDQPHGRWRQPFQQRIKMAQDRLRAVTGPSGPWREAETEQIGDVQLKSIPQLWCQATELQEAAVESMQQ